MDLARARTAHLLPAGGTLTRRQWGKRHTVIVAVLAAHLPVLLGLALVLGEQPLHALAEVLLPVLALAAARTPRLPDRVRAHAAALGLLACSALLVHLTGGSIEAHFHVFVVVSTVAFYQQWSVLLSAVGLTVVHHVGLAAVDPALVFAHSSSGTGWLLWPAVHGLALGAQCVVALVHWRLQERALEAERRLARQLLQREAALQQALHRAEVDALACGVAHELNTPVQYAADNARYVGSALLDLVDLVASTSDALEALDADGCPDGLRGLRERHRAHGREWDGEDVRQALGDCLSGLDEVARLVVELQDAAARPPRLPEPRPGQHDGAGPPAGTGAVGSAG